MSYPYSPSSPGPLGPTALLIPIQDTYEDKGILLIQIARGKYLSPNGQLGQRGFSLGNPDLTIQKNTVTVSAGVVFLDKACIPSWYRILFTSGSFNHQDK